MNASAPAAESARRPRRLWPWLLGGVGLLLLVGVGYVAFAIHHVLVLLEDAVDPEQSWSSLHAVLPYDARRDDYHVISFGGDTFFILRWQLSCTERPANFASSATLFVLPAKEAVEYRRSRARDSPTGATYSIVEVQGENLPVVRFSAEDDQHAILLDLDEPAATTQRVLELRRGDGAPVLDEDVRDFLAPFRLAGYRRRPRRGQDRRSRRCVRWSRNASVLAGRGASRARKVSCWSGPRRSRRTRVVACSRCWLLGWDELATHEAW